MKIDKNIPLPARQQKKHYPYPWEQMEIGDSFLDKNDNRSPEEIRKVISYSLAYFNRGREKRIKITTRKIDGGIRVWRIE